MKLFGFCIEIEAKGQMYWMATLILCVCVWGGGTIGTFYIRNMCIEFFTYILTLHFNGLVRRILQKYKLFFFVSLNCVRRAAMCT